MIHFPCNCGEQYEVPEDQAGTSIQCTRCGRLVDVPTLGDLAAIEEDGTYHVDGPAVQHNPAVLEDMMLAFTREKRDDFGREIDLRPTEDELSGIGEPEVLDFADEDQPRRVVPKYDPITGELIREIDVKPKEDRVEHGAVPVAKAAIGYASAKLEGTEFRASRIIPELFRFSNLVVMLVIFCVHVLLHVMLFPILMGFFLIVPAFMIVCMLLLSHYAVVVNDIATEDRDELPRPLRDLAWHEDLWGPFVQFMISLMICYGPLVALRWMPGNAAVMIAYAMAVVAAGTVAFPAIFLTATTSGSWINLTPDRVLRVMRMLGAKYVLAVVYWILGGGAYLVGILGTTYAFATLFMPPSNNPPVLLSIAIAYPLMLVGLLAMHGFCWYLGLQYREHQPDFNWAFQSHSHRPQKLVRRGLPMSLAGETPDQRRARLRANKPLPAVPVPPPPTRHS